VIRLARGDGRHAVLSVPGQPDRPVGLRRRDVPELLHEELRRLDPDDIYATTVRKLRRMHPQAASPKKSSPKKSSATKRTAKAAATKGA
jgi:hypothetical protein